MGLPRLAYKYLLYRAKSFRLHGVHSPFVFDLYQHVIRHNGHFATYTRLEKLRQKLIQNRQLIPITDLGAGSKTHNTTHRAIGHLALVSAKPAKYAQLLFRIINYFQPAIILELGTSLGLTTSYLALARQQSKVITLEGCPNIAAQATRNFKDLQVTNVKIITGNIDQTLAPALLDLPQLDFVYFDGNHRYEPTIRYFENCLAKRTPNSVFVIDDIYWSPEMEKAWKEISSHPAVTISIDLFQLGLVFFRTQQPKQHFTLYF